MAQCLPNLLPKFYLCPALARKDLADHTPWNFLEVMIVITRVIGKKVLAFAFPYNISWPVKILIVVIGVLEDDLVQNFIQLVLVLTGTVRTIEVGTIVIFLVSSSLLHDSQVGILLNEFYSVNSERHSLYSLLLGNRSGNPLKKN